MPHEYVEINSGSGGAFVAVDSIGAIQYQIVKLMMGSDGVADMLVDSGQQTMANSLPVVLPSDQLPFAVAQSGNWNVNVVNTSLTYNVTASIAAAINVANTSLSYLVTAAQSGAWNVSVSNTSLVYSVTVSLAQSINISNTSLSYLTVSAQSGPWSISSTQLGVWSVTASILGTVNVANTSLSYYIANTSPFYNVSANIINASLNIANTALTYNVTANIVNTPNVSVTSFTQGKTLKRALINQNATDTHIVNAIAGSTINVTSILLSAGAPNVATFTQSSQGPALTGPIYLALSGGFVATAPADYSAAWLQVNAGTGLNLHLAAAGSVGGCITYYEG